MADKNLKKQLESLFVDLESPLTPDNILELTEGGDDEDQEDLSSEPKESPPPLNKSAPSKPPLVMKPQQPQPIIETPPVHQTEPKILHSKPEEEPFTPSEPITPSTEPVKTEPQQSQSKVEASPTLEEDLENLLPESENPLPPEPPAPTEASPTFEEDLENLLPEPEDPIPPPKPIMLPAPIERESLKSQPIAKFPPAIEDKTKSLVSVPEDPAPPSPKIEGKTKPLVPEPEDPTSAPKPVISPIPIKTEPQRLQPIAKFPPAIEDKPKPLFSKLEDPVPSPKPVMSPTPTKREPQKLQPIAKFPPAIEDKPKPLVPKPKDPTPSPKRVMTKTTVEMEPNQPQSEEVQQVDETPSTEIEDQAQPETETECVTTEEVQKVEPTPPPVIEDDVVILLKSTEASERHEAVQNLARMHNEWTIDPLLYAAIDSDQEVARLALEGLLEMRAAVKERVLGLPQGFLTPLHLGGAAFISCLVGQPFVYIAPGPFLMGSDSIEDDPDDDSSERPQHELSLPGYWIARYPVTASQFRTFLDKSGYGPALGERDYGQDDYPVVDVTWNDALAYCLWLAQQTGLKVNLPSEAEWEKAARGTDGRFYPWGNQPPTTASYNPDKLTPVGQYSPQADSPYSCADMAGNVWEWTRTVYESYPYNPEDGRETLEGDKSRAIRGLAFNNPEKFARCTSRYRLKPILHLRTLGFRVVISPI